jgi:hypothetical protein
MGTVKNGVAGALTAAIMATLAPSECLAGPASTAAPGIVSLSSPLSQVFYRRGYYQHYYGRRYGYYRYDYDPDLAILGADLATAAVTTAYGDQSSGFAYGPPWRYDAPYPFYDYSNHSYGYGYGYPIYGGFRHRYWGPGYRMGDPGPTWSGRDGYRPWGGGFTHRGFNGADYDRSRRRVRVQ